MRRSDGRWRGNRVRVALMGWHTRRKRNTQSSSCSAVPGAMLRFGSESEKRLDECCVVEPTSVDDWTREDTECATVNATFRAFLLDCTKELRYGFVHG